MDGVKICVSSDSFCKNQILKEELLSHFPNSFFLDPKLPRTQESLIDFYQGAKAVIVGTEPLTESIVKSCLELIFVSKYGVGTDNIDFLALEKNGISFGHTGGVNRMSVAELTLGFMIGLSHQVYQSGFALKSGCWQKEGGVQLFAKKVGIIGCGNIGSTLVSLLEPFQCEILIHDIVDKSGFATSHGAKLATKEEIFSSCDFITLHVPLSEHTRYMICAKTLSMFRPDAFLINTSRGQVVCQEDLYRALLEKRIAGAALDVFEIEPPSDPAFLSLPNLMVTPHIGGSSLEAKLNMGRAAIKHLTDFFEQE